jgi:hypothetical protein
VISHKTLLACVSAIQFSKSQGSGFSRLTRQAKGDYRQARFKVKRLFSPFDFFPLAPPSQLLGVPSVDGRP